MRAEGAPGGRGRKIRALILSPTRELAAQIGESFRAYGRHAGLRHTVVYGGVSQHPQTRDLQHGVDILVATPGRLLDLMNQGFVDLSSVEIFVLDEADRMLDMGFLPDLKRVIAKIPKQRQTLFFSATMPAAIKGLADSILRNPVQVRIVPEKGTVEQIEQTVCFVTRPEKQKLLASILTTRAVTRAIVFTRTKRGADRVTQQLNKAGIPAAAIHGDKTQAARQRALAGFKANRGGVQVLVATDVAARGIDVDGISHVLNFDLPHEPETYVHRIGRTGRAGAAGIAVSFCDQEERQHLQAIERLLRRKLTVEKEYSAFSTAVVDRPASAATADAPPRSQQRRGKPAHAQSLPARRPTPTRGSTASAAAAAKGIAAPPPSIRTAPRSAAAPNRRGQSKSPFAPAKAAQSESPFAPAKAAQSKSPFRSRESCGRCAARKATIFECKLQHIAGTLQR